MNQTYEYLAKKAIEVLNQSEQDRVIISVVGIPGSGKTTSMENVANLINDWKITTTNGGAVVKCMVVGMDGFHLSRKQLGELPDPENAFLRRGAPFTFDSEKVVDFVKTLHQSCFKSSQDRSSITCPSFDHRLKDPVSDGVTIGPEVNVILFEGLYLQLDTEPWDQISKYVDATWMIHVDFKEARDRVASRHLKAGIERSIEDAYQRVDANDSLNAHYIIEHTMPVDLTVDSIHEEVE